MSRSGWRAVWLAGAGLVVCSLALHGCFTPPVILEGGRHELLLRDFPSGTETVELAVTPEITLRGVFVPAGAGAPVALCFLESMGSITYGARPIVAIGTSGTPGAVLKISGLPDGFDDEPLLYQYEVLAQLRALGCSALVVDYEGVGMSGGVRSPDNLRRDARAAWDEALRRAGGDPRRVLLRATSIGALAVATLLQDGVRPGAVTLIAPVRAETVATNFSKVKYGVLFTTLARWFVRDAVDVDLLAELRALDCPLLVIVPRRDFLLPADEVEALREAVDSVGGVLLVREANHDLLALASRGLLADEPPFLEGRLLPDRERAALDLWNEVAGSQGWRGRPSSAFDDGTPLRQRLHAIDEQFVFPGAGWVIAVALSEASETECLQLSAWSWWLPPELGATPDLELLSALVDLEDPAGDLDLRFLLHSVYDFSELSGQPLEAVLACYSDSQDPGGDIGSSASMNLLTGDVQIGEPDKWLHGRVRSERGRLVEEAGLSARDADRQILRLFLRGAGIPERYDESGDALEVWQDGAWRPLPPVPAWPATPQPAAAGDETDFKSR
ncbi:MAG TPA: alpha/beta hydrolase [Planctomycetota bacterium]|nr:alpha/beta hydrolase [Planctomycetota bacterium]